MPTYVYETVPQKPGEKPSLFEFKQTMNDLPLTTHPETGEPVRRVVLGHFGVLSGRNLDKSSGSGPCCGPDSGCCG